jgi:hypothetical protein
VIEFAAYGSETRLNITQTLAVRELSESHRQILIPAREAPVMTVAVIAGNALLELVMGKVADQLREDGAAGIHPPLFRRHRPGVFTRFGSFSVQIVFHPNANYLIDLMVLIAARKVLYRTPMILTSQFLMEQSSVGLQPSLFHLALFDFVRKTNGRPLCRRS